MEDGLDGQVGVVVLTLAHDLGAEGSFGATQELCVVVLEDVELFLDFVDALDSDVASLLEAVGNAKWVDALFQKFLGLLENGASQNDNTSGAVTDLVVLRG